MPPIAIHEPIVDKKFDIADLKAKVVFNHVEVKADPKPPLADDFMYDFKYNHVLPTSDVLAKEIPTDCDAKKEAEAIVERLSEIMGSGDAQAFTTMFLEYGECSLPTQSLKMTDSLCRCLARQAGFHLGLPYLQLPSRHSEGCWRPFHQN